MKENLLVEIRNLQIEDYLDLKNSMIEAYADWEGSHWEEKHIQKLLSVFPEGQIGVFVNGKVAGSALSIIVDYKKYGDDHTYRQITGDFTFSTHDPDGDVLYGIDVFVHPDYRNMRLARRMYDARKDLCEQLNLRAVIAGGRIPNYSKYAAEYSPKEYINKVKLRQIFDPTLTFQIANDFHVKKILRGYMAGDKSSHEYATLIQWHNIYYQSRQRLFSETKPIVRLGLVQWQMRSLANLSSLYDQIEFFVDAVSDYQSNFVLFPELFNAPLMAAYNHLSEAEAIRKLAQFTEPLRQKFMEFAISYNINIITGSMPYLDENGLRNVGYLCRRDGTFETYEKIHITPSETQSWGMIGGNKIEVFDTDSGKIGILICYDIEFPELSRIMADQQMQILFVPFLTDTQNGYIRVRNCAMARAIENECYVAIAGCVGNLPKVNNMDIQYAQSAVFTPSDFAFPTNGIKAEATPNTEMTLIVDVDLDLLKELHSFGTVRNLKDRRYDIYKLNNLTLKKQKNRPV
jgi:predicted amidohydrolase/ribosomal protein S18 acetylase RimI-like enzyme